MRGKVTQPNELMNVQDKKNAPGWERKILFLINSQPKNAKELIFKMLDSLVKCHVPPNQDHSIPT